MLRRSSLLCLLVVCLSSFSPAHAQPSRPASLILGYPAGGAADSAVRHVAERLSAVLGKQVIVENRPGANGIIAVNALKAAPADGQTILLADDAILVLNPMVYKDLPYDAARDFIPVGLLSSTPLILTGSMKLPVDDLAGLLALAKAQPGKLNYGSFGLGGISHLAGEMLKSMAGIAVEHVPYAGGGAVQQAKIAGDIDYSFGLLGSDMVFVRDGRLKALAVASPVRSPLAPEVPTLDELGFAGFDITGKLGMVVRAGTPQPLVNGLRQALNEVLRDAELKQRFAAIGQEMAEPADAQSYQQDLVRDRQAWQRYAEAIGFSIN